MKRLGLALAARGASRVLLLAAASCSCLACEPLLDLPAEPEVVPSGPWRCLDPRAERFGLTPTASDEVAQTGETARVVVRACDFVTGCSTPVTDLSAQLCDKRDVGCSSPRVDEISDIGGELRFEVPTGGGSFDGYLKVSSPLALCTDDAAFPGTQGSLCGLVPDCNRQAPDDACLVPTHAPALVFFNPPIVGDVQEPLSLQLLSSAALPSVVVAAGASLDPTTGNLFITARDCDGQGAPGVTYEIAQHQQLATSLYVDSGVVSDTASETDESGIGGFVGVPPGFVEVSGYTADGELIQRIGLQAAPFTLTYSLLTPG